MVPIRIPNEMNNIDIGITAKIVYIALLLNFNPSIIAVLILKELLIIYILKCN